MFIFTHLNSAIRILSFPLWLPCATLCYISIGQNLSQALQREGRKPVPILRWAHRAARAKARGAALLPWSRTFTTSYFAQMDRAPSQCLARFQLCVP